MKGKLSVGKVLSSVFWDYRGVVYVHFLTEQGLLMTNTTVNFSIVPKDAVL